MHSLAKDFLDVRQDGGLVLLVLFCVFASKKSRYTMQIGQSRKNTCHYQLPTVTRCLFLHEVPTVPDKNRFALLQSIN